MPVTCNPVKPPACLGGRGLRLKAVVRRTILHGAVTMARSCPRAAAWAHSSPDASPATATPFFHRARRRMSPAACISPLPLLRLDAVWCAAVAEAPLRSIVGVAGSCSVPTCNVGLPMMELDHPNVPTAIGGSTDAVFGTRRAGQGFAPRTASTGAI